MRIFAYHEGAHLLRDSSSVLGEHYRALYRHKTVHLFVVSGQGFKSPLSHEYVYVKAHLGTKHDRTNKGLRQL